MGCDFSLLWFYVEARTLACSPHPLQPISNSFTSFAWHLHLPCHLQVPPQPAQITQHPVPSCACEVGPLFFFFPVLQTRKKAVPILPLTWGQNLKIEGGWDSEEQGLLKEVSLEGKGEQRPLSCFSTARPSSLRDLALGILKRLFGGCSPHQNWCVWAIHVLILFSYSLT